MYYSFYVYAKQDLERYGSHKPKGVFGSGHRAYNFAYKLSRECDVCVYKVNPVEFNIENSTGILGMSVISKGSYKPELDDSINNNYRHRTSNHWYVGLLSVLFGYVVYIGFIVLFIGVFIVGGVSICFGICAVCPDSVENWVMTSGTRLPSLAFTPIEVTDYVNEHYSLDNTTIVHPNDGYYQIVGADGHRITLENNKNAKNVTKAEVVEFIKLDKTDQVLYTSTFQCGDFAEQVHNNAETYGITCGWVDIDSIDHACNVFNTTDCGLIFIDCTHGSGGGSWDTVVTVEKGKMYKIKPIISNGYTYESLGIVNDYKIYW